MSGMLFTVPLIAAVLFLLALADESNRLGSVEFFGAAPHSVPIALPAALPLRPGMELPEDDASRERLIAQIEQAVNAHTGKPPSDVAPVCCDPNGHWIFYIGLRGPRVADQPASRHSSTRVETLPVPLLDTYRQILEQNAAAARQGAAEEHGNGYALSRYQPLRDLQMKFRTLAVAHSRAIHSTLRQSADPEQRAAAAMAAGYLDPGSKQIKVLVDAASDSNSTVRNNALRALWVLAVSRPNLVLRHAPIARLATLLRSGEWSDRNKAMLLLMALAESGDPRLPRELKRHALPELREMAAWRNPGHADPARYLLDRVARL